MAVPGLAGRIPPVNRPPDAIAQGGRIIPTVLSSVPSVLEELGASPAAVFAAAGIDPKRLVDPEGVISYASMGRLLGKCATLTHCPHFGLLAGAKQGLPSLGIVGYLARHSPDVGSGLNNLIGHIHHYQHGGLPTLVTERGLTRFGYVVYQPRVEGLQEIYDGAMAVSANILRGLCGPEWRAAEVALPRDAPADQEPYRRVFRAPLQFGRGEAWISFPSDWLARPVPGADPMLFRVLQKQVAQLAIRLGSGLAPTVRGIVRTLLVAHRCSAEETAALFGVHRRTLHRQLKTEGVTFEALVDGVRSELAVELLSEVQAPLSHVASTLGYADVSAFSRAFRRWFGMAPAQWRATRRVGGRDDVAREPSS